MAAYSSPPKMAGSGSSGASRVSNNRAAVSPPMDTSASSSVPSSEGVPIAFFDVETSIPHKSGQGFALLEFGAILVCPRRLVELGCYSTLIRPPDLSVISASSVRCNGITRDSVASAPEFEQVADRIYEILHGKVWAGHNIIRFDRLRIREAFESINRPAPEPVGTIDSLPLLSQRFGKRAGDMKMATLANYFGLGRQKHRSLDDVRMNLEVVKHCATVLFLESSLMDTPGSHSNQISARLDAYQLPDFGEQSPSLVQELTPLVDQMKLDVCHEPGISDEPRQDNGFVEPDMVSISSISTSIIQLYSGGKKIVMMHKNTPLQLFCKGLKVHHGVNKKFLDYAGRPKLSIVVDSPAILCNVLDACDNIVRRLVLDSGSDSEWRAVVKRAFNGLSDFSTVRLQIPTIGNGNEATYSTEIHQREASGNIQKLVFSRMDVEELQTLFVPGTVLDAYFAMDLYDYQQNAGMRLMAKKLIIHPR